VQPGPSTRPRVRWGLGDFAIAELCGLGGSVVAAAFVVDAPRPVRLIVLLFAQSAAVIGYLVWVARAKGVGSLSADFGLVVRITDLAWFFVGIGLQVVALVPTQLLVEAHGDTAKQEVVRIADRAHGVQIVLIVLGVAVLAPVTEELLFRGLLLRSLLRRMEPGPAVFLAAVIFGVIHAVGDPSVGTLIALPAIIALGLVSGIQAVRTGELSRSILLHMGFNVLTVVVLFA
jgi:membrane protease YdiL (CAAX protease family)